MDCTSCSTQLPPPPPPPPSNVPPFLYPPLPPLSSTPPPPLSRTPPPPRRRTRRSSKGRWYKSNVATGSAISLSSVSFVGFVFVIYRQYFKPEEDEPSTTPVIKITGKLTLPLEVIVQIPVPDKTVKRPDKKTPLGKIEKPPPPPPSPPPPPPPQCYVPGWTPAYCGMLYPLLFNLCLQFTA
jgi:hypothetical protein